MDQEENEEDEEGVKELDPNQEKLIHSQHIYILGDENNGNHDLPLMFLGVSETVCVGHVPESTFSHPVTGRDLLSHTVRYAHNLAPELVFTMCSPLRAGQRSFKCASFSGDTQAHIHPPGKPVWTPEPNEMGVDSDENLRYMKFRSWCSDTEGRNFRTVADSA
ncbi:hypothetical protein RUM43_011424 [Polyplax serrata]|uniref:Uncharacterized protein n=1 Tax=Polyplax serrata TaxID=468196 RepID=A0AAN8PUM5_POLSC